MKKLILCLWAACGLGLAYAQTTDSLSYTALQDKAFMHLDKNRIPTGVLYDRVYPWADLVAFTNRENKTVDYAFVRQAWYELQLSTYHFDQSSTYVQFQETIRSNESANKGISIGYIDYDFNSLDSNALQDGRLYYDADSLLHDGTAGNPYLSHRLSIPVIGTQGISSGIAHFYFDPALALSNTGRRIQNITLSSPDGKRSLTLAPGQGGDLDLSGITGSTTSLPIGLNWVDGGTIIIPTSLSVNGEIPLNSTTVGKCFKEDTLSSGSLIFQGYDEAFPSRGFGNYRVFYHQQNSSWANCDQHIRKPIIIVDGFDPEDERHITSTFKNGKWYPGIWDLLEYGGNKHLGDDLRLKGYDVIVLNFPQYATMETGAMRDGGADYIERNALVLVKLIQKVNDELQQNGSTEKIVVVGPSMGGQIARYALAYMEKQQSLGVANMHHNTRLYVSFDSPHKGANIPISAQQALYHLGYFANQADAKTSYDVQLRSAAARQMLIEQMDGLNRTASFHNTYYTALNSGGLANSQGWPLNLRKVALVNGNTAGIKTNGMADRVFHVDANTLAGTIKAIDMNLYNMPDYNNSLETYNGYLKSPSWGFGMYNQLVNITGLSANMTGTSQDIFSGFMIAYGLHTYKGKFNTLNTNANGSMDVVPGGTYNTIKILKDKLADQLQGQTTASTVHWADLKFSHCFIPTVSSLAMKNANFNWSDPLNNRNLVCTQEIPFDNYYAPAENEEHVHLTEASAKWITQEIEKGQAGCAPICKSTLLVNNDVSPLCINSTRYFAHNYTLPPGATVSWSVEGSVLQKISYNNYGITVKAIEASFNTDITYTIENPCGANVRGTFSLMTGLPDVSEIAYAINANTNMVKVTPFMPQQITYSWGWNGSTFGYVNSNPYPASFPHAATPYNMSTMPKLWLKAENICGSYTQYTYPTIPAAYLSARPEAALSVYPNPAQDYWTVNVPSGKEQSDLLLYNIKGAMVWQGKASDYATRIPAERLASGTYILKVQPVSGSVQTIKLSKY